jgi:hypothetical protein
VTLCRELNARGARYIVVGGMAIVQQGFVRATEDIDLLIEKSQENQERVRMALETLPDKAVREMTPTDLENYLVVRVLDEIVIDLMLQACGIAYEEAISEVERVVIDDVEIPFASAPLLWKMKQTVREKDALDRQFLRMKLEKKK